MRTRLLLRIAMLVSVAKPSLWMSAGTPLYPYDSTPLNHTTQIPGILKVLVSGPLSGKSITLVLEDATPLDAFQSDNLVEATSEPFLILRLPRERPETVSMNDTVTGILTEYYIEYYPLTPSILVIVMATNNPFWWPLTFPPDHWHMKALILIVSSHMCSPSQYFQTPLLERPSSLAVLCPHFAHSPQETLPFRVWTLKPYVEEEGKLVDLGIWSQESFRTWEDLFIDRFRDMTTYNMSILVQTSDFPLVYILQGTNVLSGLNIVIMDALQYWLHFDLKYKNRTLLRFTENFESIQRGYTDVFINYGTITAERSDLFDITVPYFREGWGIVLEIPPPLPRWQNVLYPFSLWVWGAVVGSMCCVTLTYHALNYKRQHSIVTNGITVMQSLLSRPLDHVPKRWHLRIFLVVWWLVAWWLNLAYTCNLIAVLTVPVLPTKIQTSEGLIASDYRLCMVDYGEFMDEALAASTNPVFEALYRKLDMVPSSDVMEYIGEEQCIERVLAGTHAHTETYSYIVILYNMLGHGSKVYPFKEQLYPAYLGFFVRKHVPWKYKFDQGMEQMLAAGLVDKWYKDSMADFAGYMEKTTEEGLTSLTLGHLQGPFLFYGIGNLLASFLILAEFFFPRCIRRI